MPIPPTIARDHTSRCARREKLVASSRASIHFTYADAVEEGTWVR